jgi:hypothetical protein
VEQGLERRTGVLDAAVLEIAPGDALLGLADVLDAVDEDLQACDSGRRMAEVKTARGLSKILPMKWATKRSVMR